MSSEITLTPQEQDRILNLAASFVNGTDVMLLLRDAITYDVKRLIALDLKQKREAYAPDYRLRP